MGVEKSRDRKKADTSSMKVCFVLTTRGNYAKSRKLTELLRNDPQFEVQIVANNKAYTKPDFPISFFVKGGDHDAIGQSVALMASECSSAFRMLKPDCVVLIADRFEVLSAATVASCMNIPIIHLEGGEISGSVDENLRHAITKLAHLHFTATYKATQRVLRLGEEEHNVFQVGSTSIDAIPKYIEESKFWSPYILVILHPIATQISGRNHDIQIVFDAVKTLKLHTIWIAPNYDANYYFVNEYFARLGLLSFVEPVRTFPFGEFIRVLNSADCIIGNSSCGIRESSYLGVPSVNIGSRQNNREYAENVIHVKYDTTEIVEAVNVQRKHGRYKQSTLYGDGKASERIVNVLKKHEFKIQKQLAY